MRIGAMRISEWIGAGQLARRLGWATAAGALLGLLGPFGSYSNGDAAPRMAYYIGVTWLGTVVLTLFVRPAQILAGRAGVPEAFAVAAAVVAACVPLSAMIAVADHLAFPDLRFRLSPLEWYAQVLSIAAPMVALGMWAERRDVAPALPASGLADPMAPAPAVSVDARAVESLPRAREILCLQMEDHYVRVHRADGSALVLMTLSQAIAGMEGAGRAGAQVHRSWWVARDAVSGWLPHGRAGALTLTNGLAVPVARGRIAQLRAEGWLPAVENAG